MTELPRFHPISWSNKSSFYHSISYAPSENPDKYNMIVCLGNLKEPIPSTPPLSPSPQNEQTNKNPTPLGHVEMLQDIWLMQKS